MNCPLCKKSTALKLLAREGTLEKFRCSKCGGIVYAHFTPAPPSATPVAARLVVRFFGPTKEEIAALRRISPDAAKMPIVEVFAMARAGTWDLGEWALEKAKDLQKRAEQEGLVIEREER